MAANAAVVWPHRMMRHTTPDTRRPGTRICKSFLLDLSPLLIGLRLGRPVTVQGWRTDALREIATSTATSVICTLSAIQRKRRLELRRGKCNATTVPEGSPGPQACKVHISSPRPPSWRTPRPSRSIIFPPTIWLSPTFPDQDVARDEGTEGARVPW